VIKSITSIQFQARSGDDLTELLQRLVVRFDRSGKSRRSMITLLGSSSGRFTSSIEAIKADAITELAPAQSGLPVVRVTAASFKEISIVRRGRSSERVQRRCSIRRDAIRTGRKARPAPSRSLGGHSETPLPPRVRPNDDDETDGRGAIAGRHRI
jgi:hypothetical protein